ncbi:MAG: leucine-rich repeat domain-containing protein [Peptostreptococcus sp.]
MGKIQEKREQKMFVDFECDNLKKAIIKNYKEKIDSNFDGTEVTSEMMEKFDLLDLNESGISSLKGIEYAKNVRHLYVAFNSISDVEPLKNCQNLEKLDFHKNNVVDIWPLEGLRRLEFLNISNNGITDVMALNDIANIDAINIKGNNIENQLPLRHIRFVKK